MTREWSWLKGGIALGLLSAFAFISYKPLGVSTSYPRAVGIILNPIVPDFVAQNAYFQRVPPIVDWQLMLVLGIIVGGFIASRVVRRAEDQTCAVSTQPSGVSLGTASGESSASKKVSQEAVMVTATGTGGEDAAQSTPVTRRRKWMAFAGGFLLLFGARLAGGCTSGHVITGMTQLATASFLFAAAVFAVGIPVAMMTRKKGWV